MTRRPVRPRAIAIARPAPYSGPGHLVIIAAMAVLALLLFSGQVRAHAEHTLLPAGSAVLDADHR